MKKLTKNEIRVLQNAINKVNKLEEVLNEPIRNTTKGINGELIYTVNGIIVSKHLDDAKEEPMFSECKCKKCSYCASKDREVKAIQSELNDAYLMLDNRDRRVQGLKRDIVERELYISELVKEIIKLNEDLHIEELEKTIYKAIALNK